MATSFASRVSRLDERALMTMLYHVASQSHTSAAPAPHLTWREMTLFCKRFGLSDLSTLAAPLGLDAGAPISRANFRRIVRALCAASAADSSQLLPDVVDAAHTICTGAAYVAHVEPITLTAGGELTRAERALLLQCAFVQLRRGSAVSRDRVLELLQMHSDIDEERASQILALVSPIVSDAPLGREQFAVACSFLFWLSCSFVVLTSYVLFCFLFSVHLAVQSTLPDRVGDSLWMSARSGPRLKRSVVDDATLQQFSCFGFDDLFLDVSDDDENNGDAAAADTTDILAVPVLLDFDSPSMRTSEQRHKKDNGDNDDDDDTDDEDEETDRVDVTSAAEEEEEDDTSDADEPVPAVAAAAKAKAKIDAKQNDDDDDDDGDDVDDDDGEETYQSDDDADDVAEPPRARGTSFNEDSTVLSDTLTAGMSEFVPLNARNELVLPVMCGVTLPFVEGSLRAKTCDTCGAGVDLAPLMRSSVPHTGVPLPAELPMRPLARGVMLKRGGFVKNLKQRFFILAGQHLCYYQKTTALTTAPPLGVIHLDRTCTVDTTSKEVAANAKPPKGFSFMFVLQAHQRTWQFFCKSDRERELWVQALRASCGRRVEAPVCFYCRQVIDVASDAKVLLSAPLRCLAPLAPTSVRAVFIAGHLLLFQRADNDLVWDDTTVPSGRPLACVHLHRARADRRTATVFEIGEVYDAAQAGTTQFVVTPRNPRTAKDRKAHLYAFELVDCNGDGETELKSMTRVASALRAASHGGDVQLPVSPRATDKAAEAAVAQTQSAADEPLIGAPRASPSSRVSNSRPTGSNASSPAGKTRTGAATLAGAAAASEMSVKSPPPRTGPATDEHIPARRPSASAAKGHARRKTDAPVDETKPPRVAKSPSRAADQEDGVSPRKKSLRKEKSTAAAATVAPTSPSAEVAPDQTLSSMATVDATRIELFRLEQALAKSADPNDKGLTSPTGRPPLRRVSARKQVDDANEDPERLPVTKSRRGPSLHHRATSPAVVHAAATSGSGSASPAVATTSAASSASSSPATGKKASTTASTAVATSPARATTAAPPVAAAAAVASPAAASESSGDLNARMYFDSSDEEDDPRRKKIVVAIRETPIAKAADNEEDALNAFVAAPTSPRAAVVATTARPRGRKNAEKRLTFSDLGRNAYLLGSVGMKVDDVDPATGDGKENDAAADEASEEAAPVDVAEEAAAAAAAKKAKREARARARKKKDGRKKDKEAPAAPAAVAVEPEAPLKSPRKDESAKLTEAPLKSPRATDSGEKRRRKPKRRDSKQKEAPSAAPVEVATPVAAVVAAVVAPVAASAPALALNDEHWYYVGVDNRQHAFDRAIAAKIEDAWSNQRFGDQIEVSETDYVVVYTSEDIRQFTRTTKDLLGIVVERASDGGVERASRYPTTLPPSLRRSYQGASATPKPGLMPSPVLRAMREQREQRMSRMASKSSATSASPTAAATAAAADSGAMSALTFHLPADADGIERAPVRVMVRESTTYAELCRRLIKACSERGIEHTDKWLVYVVSLDSGDTIGCLADLEETLKPRACDTQLRDEGVNYKYVFRPAEEADDAVVVAAAAAPEASSPAAEPAPEATAPEVAAAEPVAHTASDATAAATVAVDGGEMGEALTDDEATEGSMSGRGDKPSPARAMASTTTAEDDGEDDDEEEEGEEQEEEEEEDDDDSDGEVDGDANADEDDESELNSDDSSLSESVSARLTAPQQFTRALLLLERGAFVRSSQRVSAALDLLGEPVGETSEAQETRLTQIRICAQYALALKLLVTIRDAERDMRSKDPATLDAAQARVAYLSLVLSSVPLSKTAHRLVCVRMAVARNFSARNYGVVATHVQALRKILMASSAFGDAEQADVKDKMERCRAEQFRNFGMELYCGGVTSLPSNKFSPTKFCCETYEPLDDALGFIESVSCTVCDSHFKDDGGARVGKSCSLCRWGTLG
jgi:hypothetical protein